MRYINGTERPEIIEMIRAEARKIPYVPLAESTSPQQHEPDGLLAQRLLRIKPANQWLAEEQATPRPKMLFGSLWLEEELCIMFADTNMGKSILAVQIADSISRKKPIGNFELEAPAGPVLYIDFELNAKQFEMRYTDAQGSYQFSPNFYRAQIDLQAGTPASFKTFNQYMEYSLQWAVKSTGVRVLIVDNITCLRSGTESAGQAQALMRSLKLLKEKYSLSILVLAHTPKRALNKPICRNDLGGSKMIMNFADSAFALAPSGTKPGWRYVKQVKQRSAHERYGAGNVCLCQLVRNGSFLKHQFNGHATEASQLFNQVSHELARQAKQIAALQAQGQSQRQIAAGLGISVGKVNRLLNWKAGEG